MEVGIRPANREPYTDLRPAVVTELVDLPGYRRNRARIRYVDGGEATLPLWRLVPVNGS